MKKREAKISVGKEPSGEFPLFISVSAEGDSRSIADSFEEKVKEFQKKGKAEVEVGYNEEYEGGYKLLVGSFSDLETMRRVIAGTFGDGQNLVIRDISTEGEEETTPEKIMREAKELMENKSAINRR